MNRKLNIQQELALFKIGTEFGERIIKSNPYCNYFYLVFNSLSQESIAKGLISVLEAVGKKVAVSAQLIFQTYIEPADSKQKSIIILLPSVEETSTNRLKLLASVPFAKRKKVIIATEQKLKAFKAEFKEFTKIEFVNLPVNFKIKEPENFKPSRLVSSRRQR